MIALFLYYCLPLPFSEYRYNKTIDKGKKLKYLHEFTWHFFFRFQLSPINFASFLNNTLNYTCLQLIVLLLRLLGLEQSTRFLQHIIKQFMLSLNKVL